MERATTMRAIVNLADELGIGVITQGVETSQQRDLSNATSTIAQGLYFADALDVAGATGLLRVGSIDVPSSGAVAPETSTEETGIVPQAAAARTSRKS
jgi:EAL domain-containing protein (putative c-di-GMP-specific phosphodiesterase class I)